MEISLRVGIMGSASTPFTKLLNFEIEVIICCFILSNGDARDFTDICTNESGISLLAVSAIILPDG